MLGERSVDFEEGVVEVRVAGVRQHINFITVYQQRMSDYTHPYSTYVNHILNKSPSKTAYSFSKSERFPNSRRQDPVLEPCMQANGHEFRSGDYYKQKMGYPDASPSPQRHQNNQNLVRNTRRIEDFGVKKEVEEILRKMERGKAERSRSKSKSPARQYRPGYIMEDRALETKQFNYSPSRKRINSKERSPSSSKRGKRTLRESPSKKTYTQQLEELDHPSQKMTITGYYPVGVEISPNGKYASSRIKNVTGPKFAGSPAKQRPPRERDESLGPGYYDYFSEFGQTGRTR